MFVPTSGLMSGPTSDPMSKANSSAIEEDVTNVAFPIPSDPKDVGPFLNIFIRTKFTEEVVKPLKRGQLLSDANLLITKLFLEALRNLDLYPGLANEMKLRNTLLTIGGCCPAKPQQITFPEPFPQEALQIYDHFTAQDWGDYTVIDDNLADAPDNPDHPDNVAPATTSGASREQRPPTDFALIKRPSPNHPIYGTQGIMHDILIKTSGQLRTYIIDPSYPKRNASVFGSNGLKIGDWWPLQRCTLRDGAHGHAQAGIFGIQQHGAYSIVVSGLYKNLDYDRGDRLWYSSSDSHQNNDPTTPKVSGGAKLLRKSIITQKPVRVLRSSQSTSEFAPVLGIRYDGLYRVVAEETQINLKGGAYVRFRLQRIAGQNPIDRTRPTSREKREYELVRRGY